MVARLREILLLAANGIADRVQLTRHQPQYS